MRSLLRRLVKAPVYAVGSLGLALIVVYLSFRAADYDEQEA